MKRRIFLAAALLAISGCGGTPPVAMAPTVEKAPTNELPLPDKIGLDGKYVYALGPLDTISIEVDGIPDSLREVVIDGQGMISYPLAGSVSAAGLTTSQLANLLASQMRQNHVLDPRVNVNMVTPVSNSLTLDGEVNKPGIYPVYNDMTLMKAVALAGGDTEFSRSTLVMVFRKAKGQEYVGVYSLKAIRYGNYSDPKVYPNDKIVVGESQVRRLLQTIQPIVQLITAPLIYAIRRN